MATTELETEKVNFRIGVQDHARVRKAARERGQSINEFVVNAITAANAKLTDQDAPRRRFVEGLDTDRASRALMVPVCVRIPGHVALEMKRHIADLEAIPGVRQVWPGQYIRRAVLAQFER